MINWFEMDEVDCFDFILKQSRIAKASQIMISSDSGGAAIYFVTEKDLQYFDHIPPKKYEPMIKYIKGIFGIESYKEPPLTGVGIVANDGEEFTLSVKITNGSVGNEIYISVF